MVIHNTMKMELSMHKWNLRMYFLQNRPITKKTKNLHCLTHKKSYMFLYDISDCLLVMSCCV